MVYADYYHMSIGWTGAGWTKSVPVPGTGSDMVYCLDGRKTLRNQMMDAEIRARYLNKHLNLGIVGYCIMAGESFFKSVPLTKYVPLSRQ